MQITHQADYAMRAVMYLARLAPGEKVPTSQISDEYRIPPAFLMKIVAQLAISGLIRTSRGAKGGVALARPAEEISVLEVLEAIDGPVALNQCANDPESCPLSEDCTMQHFWHDISSDLVEHLRSTTFAQLSVSPVSTSQIGVPVAG